MTQRSAAVFPGLHVAIIMDGNGRWAQARKRPRTFGHREGARAVRRIVEAAPRLGVGVLTLYAFSSDNWRRPPAEVRTLMRLFQRHLIGDADELAREGVKLRVIGRRDRLPQGVLDAIQLAETRTSEGRRLLLRVAVDYSSRDAIVTAAHYLRGQPNELTDGVRHEIAPVPSSGAEVSGRDEFAWLLSRAVNEDGCVADVDLLVRTGGERRLSDFLLWECAYAELYFTEVMWPDFNGETLAAALADFRSRERRFGRVPDQAAG
jgi:undecaprenyl diphosphate synthase